MLCDKATVVTTLQLTPTEGAKNFSVKQFYKTFVTQFHVHNHNYILLLVQEKNTAST